MLRHDTDNTLPPATAVTAFVDYNSACRPLLPQSRLRGGRGVRAVAVATLNANSVKKQSINAKSEPSKCSGLAISRRRRIYAMIGVDFGRKARKGHNCEDTFAYVSNSSKDIGYSCLNKECWHIYIYILGIRCQKYFYKHVIVVKM